MKRFLIACAFALCGTSVLADENTTAARDFLVTCGQRLPETKQTVTVLKDAGWRYEASDGNYHYYSQNGRRIIAATTVTSSSTQGCLTAINKLDKAGGIAIGTAAAKALGLKKVTDALPPDIYAAWEGTLNGRPGALAVSASGDFAYVRGVSLIVIIQ